MQVVLKNTNRLHSHFVLHLFFVIRAERTAPVAAFVAGFYMNGDICPGVLHKQVRFEVVGKIVGLGDGDIPGDDQMELDEDLRAGSACPETMEPGILA